MSNEYSMDKSAFSVVSLHDNSDGTQFWRSKTGEERLAALEYLRQTAYGYDAATTRLQRVLEVVKRK